MHQEFILKLSTYNIAEHRHNFACWTAARAAQRSYATTKIITDAIEAAQLREKLIELTVKSVTVEEYEKFHKEMVLRILGELLNLGANKDKTTYGRVAKIIAIYVKTVYILADPESAISKVAHPPIDRILLTNLKAKGIVIDKLDWTNFNPKDYQDLIARLYELVGDSPFWKLETFWKAS
jgi:hypothetical protein